jgi:hypothetical protein
LNILELGDFLRSTSVSWSQLPEQAKAVAYAALMPAGPEGTWTAEQSGWLRNWGLVCDQATADQINFLCPEWCVAPVRGGFIGADTLTQCQDESGMWWAAKSIIESLKIAEFPPEASQPDEGG